MHKSDGDTHTVECALFRAWKFRQDVNSLNRSATDKFNDWKRLNNFYAQFPQDCCKAHAHFQTWLILFATLLLQTYSDGEIQMYLLTAEDRVLL